MQNAWIPNSYRINRPNDLTQNSNSNNAKEVSREKADQFNNAVIEQKLNNKKSETILAKKIVPKESDKFKLSNNNNYSNFTVESSLKVDTLKGQFDEYHIVEVLGKGSYATVYLAKAYTDSNKKVAIKVFDGK